MQRAQFIAAHHGGFGFLRGGAGAVLVQSHHGIHRMVHLADALQAAFQQFNRGKLTPPYQAARFNRSQVTGLGHGRFLGFCT
jgi:hypothetical protein